MSPAPGIEWECSLAVDEQQFSIIGRMPDFGSPREPFLRQPTEAKSNGPEWSKGDYEVVAVAAAPDFRRYIVSWLATDGSEYLLDMVLLRDDSGIANLRMFTPFNKTGGRIIKYIAGGVCESDFQSSDAKAENR